MKRIRVCLNPVCKLVSHGLTLAKKRCWNCGKHTKRYSFPGGKK